jgi:hypothetical protein
MYSLLLRYFYLVLGWSFRVFAQFRPSNEIFAGRRSVGKLVEKWRNLKLIAQIFVRNKNPKFAPQYLRVYAYNPAGVGRVNVGIVKTQGAKMRVKNKY